MYWSVGSGWGVKSQVVLISNLVIARFSIWEDLIMNQNGFEKWSRRLMQCRVRTCPLNNSTSYDFIPKPFQSSQKQIMTRFVLEPTTALSLSTSAGLPLKPTPHALPIYSAGVRERRKKARSSIKLRELSLDMVAYENFFCWSCQEWRTIFHEIAERKIAANYSKMWNLFWRMLN